VEQRTELLPTFSVRVKFWLHSDCISELFFLDPEDIKVLIMGRMEL